jgi:hypothetical protein
VGLEQRTLRLLLIPQPLLSLAYVGSIRAQMVEPSFAPVLLFAAFPLTAVVGTIARFRTRPVPGQRHWGVLAIGLLELAWAVMTLAIVGFAIAWRSG